MNTQTEVPVEAATDVKIAVTVHVFSGGRVGPAREEGINEQLFDVFQAQGYYGGTQAFGFRVAHVAPALAAELSIPHARVKHTKEYGDMTVGTKVRLHRAQSADFGGYVNPKKQPLNKHMPDVPYLNEHPVCFATTEDVLTITKIQQPSTVESWKSCYAKVTPFYHVATMTKHGCRWTVVILPDNFEIVKATE